MVYKCGENGCGLTFSESMLGWFKGIGVENHRYEGPSSKKDMCKRF